MKPQVLVPAAIGVGLLVLVATVLASVVTGESIGMFTRDTRTLAAETGGDLRFYAGAVSTFNGWVWASAATLSLVAGALLPGRRWFLVVFGLLLLALAADDSFMLHETVGPSQGVPEIAFYVVYAVTGADLLWRAVSGHRDGSTVAFVAGGALLALSIGADVALTDQYLLEDGGKLVGGLLWLAVPVITLGQQRATRSVDVTRRELDEAIRS